MPDVIEAKQTGTQYEPHPEGQFAVRCVDVIDLGEKLEQFPGSPERLIHKCVLVFQSGEKNELGKLHEVSAEVTVSMHEKATLRKLLEDWRGKSYSEEQARAGVPVHKLAGHPALMNVEHKVSGAGRTYAKIRGISPLPKGMTAPDLPAYERPAFWKERKEEYAATVAKYKARIGLNGELDEMPEGLDEDDPDSLPF